MNEYEIPEIVEIDRAKNAILGEKAGGPFDSLNGDDRTVVIDPDTDIEE